MITLELSGLKGHHPLGFLAACGLLRVANDEIDLRLGWVRLGGNSAAFTARVSTSCVETEDQLRERLLKVVADSAVRYLRILNEYKLTAAEALCDDYREKGAKIINEAGRGDGDAQVAAELLSGIGSDVTARQKTSGKNKGERVIRNSHLLMTSGQQDILKTEGRKPATQLARRSRKGDGPAQVAQDIQEALFGPWRYKNDEHPLGWDPQFQRLHALRSKAPKGDKKNRSVRAAVFLASQALPLFPCFGVGSQLCTTGFYRDDREDYFAWPIWSEPLSLDTLRSLLAHPFSNDLKRRGVEVVYCCHRAPTGGSKGDYRVFSQAELRPWGRKRGKKSNRPAQPV